MVPFIAFLKKNVFFSKKLSGGNKKFGGVLPLNIPQDYGTA